jgi:hypothetical protein
MLLTPALLAPALLRNNTSRLVVVATKRLLREADHGGHHILFGHWYMQMSTVNGIPCLKLERNYSIQRKEQQGE